MLAGLRFVPSPGNRIEILDRSDTIVQSIAPLAQLDRAPHYGCGGSGFESSRAYSFLLLPHSWTLFLFQGSSLSWGYTLPDFSGNVPGNAMIRPDGVGMRKVGMAAGGEGW